MKIRKYLNTKNFSKMLAFGILLNSTSINSFASILSEDGRYETFEGSNITISDVLEEDKVDIEIEGNTLVNLINSEDHSNMSEGSITIKGNYSGWGTKTIFLSDNIKPNTTYTLFANIKSIVLPESGKTPWIEVFNNKVHISGLLYSNINNCITFKTSNSLSNELEIRFIVTDNRGGTASAEFNNIMLLEGDWTNRDKPKYFEGMKSVGECKKLEIKTINKNLFDINNITLLNIDSGTKNNISDGRINVVTQPNGYGISLGKFFLKKGTYTVSADVDTIEGSNLGFRVYANGTYSNCGNPLTFTTTYDQNIELYFYNGMPTSVLSSSSISNIQLEMSDTATEYSPYRESSQVINIKPLRALPNGIKDKIIKKNGQWFIERNCGEIIIDKNTINNYYLETSIPYSDTSSINTTKFSIFYNMDNIDNTFRDILNNKLNSYYDSEIYTKDIEGIGINNVQDRLFISLNKSKLSSDSKKGLKEYLVENPISVLVKLKTPIYEPLNINSTINTYLDTTHISTNSTIPANLKVTVDRVANKAKEYSELAKENPTIENISLARMWTNKMRESILKDEFQDSVDSITEITDMTLERKTASSNVDVYIKSENMLSMNLSTNSITFEDFSGVEDMIKENAVNISINSSLPYNLNAYLATEIQSSDKSNTMNKDILSIKDNSETDYQTFTNTIDKVVLKSNCNSGNDKQHDINLKLNGGIAHKKDVYKTTIKFEAEQQ